MPAYRVTAPAFAPVLSPPELSQIRLHEKFLMFLDLSFYNADYTITPERTAQRLTDVVAPCEVLTGEFMRHSPSLGISDAALSPFAWTPSRSSGASPVARPRAVENFRGLPAPLALLDCVPINDLWDGSIRWDAIPFEGLWSEELVPGAGATAWGDSTAGVLQFFQAPAIGKIVTKASTPPPRSAGFNFPPKKVVVGDGQIDVSAGNLGTRTAEIVATQPTVNGVVQVFGRDSSTDGFVDLPRGQRGPVDIPQGAHTSLMEARWRQVFGSRLQVTMTVRDSATSVGLGTAYQQDGRHDTFASVELYERFSSGIESHERIYTDSRHGHHRFAAVNAARTSESPAVDTFAEPVRAWGASWTASWTHGDGRTNAGADLRVVRGESRSNVDFSNGAFTHQRIAGGDERNAGLYLIDHQRLAASLKATVGARLDFGEQLAGDLRLLDRRSGVVIEDQHISERRGFEFSPSAGVVWQPTTAWHVKASTQQGFRRPTLDELYGESGANSLLLEPNPALRSERSTTAQLVIEYHPADPLLVSLSTFATELRDALGTRAIVRGTGESPLLDSLPSDYQGRTPINYDRARVVGAHASLGWSPTKHFNLMCGVLLTDSRIQRVSADPALAGKTMAYSPRQTFILNASWQATPKTELTFRLRQLGRSFADSENTQALADAVVADIGIRYSLSKNLSFNLVIENVGNAQVAIARSPSGLTYLGAPTLVSCGLRYGW